MKMFENARKRDRERVQYKKFGTFSRNFKFTTLK